MNKMFSTLGHNPWPGPMSYQDPQTSKYEQKFCGREREILDLLHLIDEHFFVTLYGMSGIGKSSLLNAGVFPELRKMQYLPISIRLIYAQSGESFLEYVIKSIEQAVASVGGHIETINVVEEDKDTEKDEYLWNYFARHCFYNNEGNVLFPVIVLDQFEEVLRTSELRRRAEKLLNQIVYLVDEDHTIDDCYVDGEEYSYDFNFRFVLSIREDDLYRLEDSIDKDYLVSLKQNRYRLRGMNCANAEKVVTIPSMGLITEDKVRSILENLKESRGEDDEVWNPAILSLFMYLYYENEGETDTADVFSDYYRDATSSQHIDAVSLTYLEDHLLTEAGNRNMMLLSEAQSKVSTESLNSLISSKIILVDKRNGIDYVEFSHDRLCAVAKKNREERVTREQARKARRRMLLSLCIFAVSATMLSVVLLLTIKYQTSEEGRLSAIEQNEIIQSQRDSLGNLNAVNLVQKEEITAQRDSIAMQRDSIEKSLQIQELQNKMLVAQLAVIKEKDRKIKELLAKPEDKIVIENNVAGALSDSITYNALMNVVDLTISGDLNATDIEYLKNAFKGNKLKHIDLGDVNIVEGGVEKGTNTNKTEIGNLEFYGSIETVILPKTITAIGRGMFVRCKKLTSVTIPNSVTSIGGNAFGGCNSLASIVIPSSVTTIGGDAFRGCSGLIEIKVEKGNTMYDSRDNCNAIIVTSTNSLIKGSTNSIIPYGVATIEKKAFQDCSGLTSITIPNSVTSIGENAFSGCSGLTSITIPNSVTSIGENAFSGCSGLMSITIPPSVTTIGRSAFIGCSGLKSIEISNSVTTIEYKTFSGCSGLTSITIPNSVTSIGDNAFWECSELTSITIPSSVTSIGNSAFRNCSELTSITIPNSVSFIGYNAFADCRNLARIYSQIEKDNFEMIVKEGFKNIPKNCTWYVPVGMVNDYKAQSWWIDAWDIFEVEIPTKDVNASFKD